MLSVGVYDYVWKTLAAAASIFAALAVCVSRYATHTMYVCSIYSQLLLLICMHSYTHFQAVFKLSHCISDCVWIRGWKCLCSLVVLVGTLSYLSILPSNLLLVPMKHNCIELYLLFVANFV